MAHRIWISLFALVPGVNIFIAFYLGLNGNKLAWKKNNCLSADEYRKSQELWLKWSVVVYVVAILFFAIFMMVIAYSDHLSEEIALRDSQRISDTSTIISAVNNYKLEHNQSCPKKLELLVPQYIESIPTDPHGRSYDYRTAGEVCFVSASLESRQDIPQGDAIADNGNVFDQQSQDLNSYMFYEEQEE